MRLRKERKNHGKGRKPLGPHHRQDQSVKLDWVTPLTRKAGQAKFPVERGSAEDAGSNANPQE